MAAYKPTTWREQRVAIRPETHETIYFNDTNPNHILLSNSGGSPIFVGTSSIADAQTYDIIIPGFGTRLYPRMQGTTRIYVYTESVEEVIIQVTSWEGDFDPASIPQSQEMVAGGSDGLLGIVDINNFMQPLPPGDNFIGKVEVTELKNPLPPGTNHLGEVTIRGGGQDYTEKLNELKAAIEKGGNVIDYTELLNVLHSDMNRNFQGLAMAIMQMPSGGGGDTGDGEYYPPSSGGGSSIDYSDQLSSIQYAISDVYNKIPYASYPSAEYVETLITNTPLPAGETIGFNDYGIYVGERKELCLVFTSTSNAAGKITLKIGSSSFLNGDASSDFVTVATYTINKPAGAFTQYINKDEIPVLGKGLVQINATLTPLEGSFPDGETKIVLTGVSRY